MSEEQELLARIGRLAGSINIHKSRTPDARTTRQENFGSTSPLHPSTRTSYRAAHVAPYGRGRARAGRYITNPHRNRTLILGHVKNSADSNDLAQSPALATDSPSRSDSDAGARSARPKNDWVTRRDRHMQLINTSIYDKETHTRNRAMDQTRRQEVARKDQREKYKINKHLRGIAPLGGRSSLMHSVNASPIVHEIQIEGLRFQVMEGGSKLARIHDAYNSDQKTPRRYDVGGVTFFRSRNGNLYRSGIIKARKKFGKVKKIDQPCKRFTATGQCSKGPLCPYTHNPAAVAICKDYLQTGSCPAGDACDLSHDPTPARVPACLHFLRGKCSNSSCRYAHVRVNPAAKACRDFATLGYCGKGASCDERHVHECPDHANTGTCRNPKCRLPHVDRAGQIRKHSANNTEISKSKSAISGEESDSDLSSAEEEHDEIDSDDVDSDGLEEYLTPFAENTDHVYSQQADYVSLRDGP